jgi:hypothetical protein
MRYRITKWGNAVEVYLVEGKDEEEAWHNFDKGDYELVYSDFDDTDMTIEEYD